MGSIAYIKIFGPIIANFIKELLLPSSVDDKDKKTTLGQRLGALFIILLIGMVAFLFENLSANSELRMKAENKIDILTADKKRMQEQINTLSSKLNTVTKLEPQEPVVPNEPVPNPDIPTCSLGDTILQNRYKTMEAKINERG